MAAVAATTQAPVDVEANLDSIVLEANVQVDVEASFDISMGNPESKQKDSSSTTSTDISGATSGKTTSTGDSAIFRQGGTVPSAICLCKAAIGAGILSMAASGAEVGFTYLLAAMVVGALLSMVSIRMIAGASISTKCWSYEDICEELFHPAFSFFTGLINVSSCIGAAAAHLIVCGQVFQVISGCTEDGRKIFVGAIGTIICAPLALAPHLSFLRHLAALSVLALVLLVFVVVWYFGEHGPDESVTRESFFAGTGTATVFTYMNCANTIMASYNNAFNVPQLTGELKPVPAVSRMSKVSFLSVGLCFALYTSCSVFGLLAFGVGENQRDSLILDLYPERRNSLVDAALLAVMFSVLTCFQFLIFPIRQFAAFTIRKIRDRRAEDEKTDLVFHGRSLTRWFDIASALSAVLVIVFVAVVVQTLRTLLEFIGAFAGAYLCFVVPPLWAIQVRRRQPGFTWCSCAVLGYVAFLTLGVFLFVFGTYSAILNSQ
jgi:amino acid permease